MSTDNHPFLQPLDDQTVDELDKKMADLANRWRIARQMGMGEDVLRQLDLMIVSIEQEKLKRLPDNDKPDGVVLDTDPIKDLPNVPARPTQIPTPKKP